MDEIAKVLFGAAVGFIAAVLGDAIRRRRASQVAAMMLLRELDFHQQRLEWAQSLDASPEAQYGLMLPAPVWTAQCEPLLAGAKARQAEALLNWYATLQVLGHQIGRQIGPSGAQLIGPDRARMADALLAARRAALQLASGSLLWSYRSNQQSLFQSAGEIQAAPIRHGPDH